MQHEIVVTDETLRQLRDEILPRLEARERELVQRFVFDEWEKHEILQAVDIKKSFFYKKWKEACERVVWHLEQLEKE